MEAAPFKNHLFPIWGLFLVSFGSGVSWLSRYDTYVEWRNVLKLSAIAYKYLRHGSKVGSIPFWILWGLIVLKSLYTILSGYLVSKSLWHGQSSKLLQEYMDGFTPDRCNPKTMEGYTYLVYGESTKNIKIGDSAIIIDHSSRSLVTLDRIWRCGDPLLRRPVNRWGNNAKDMCLAFALSRLLRCRMEGATLHEGAVSTTRKLIC